MRILAGSALLCLFVLTFLSLFAVADSRRVSAQEYKAWVGTVAPGVQMFEDNHARCYMWYSNPPWCFEKGR